MLTRGVWRALRSPAARAIQNRHVPLSAISCNNFFTSNFGRDRELDDQFDTPNDARIWPGGGEWRALDDSGDIEGSSVSNIEILNSDPNAIDENAILRFHGKLKFDSATYVETKQNERAGVRTAIGTYAAMKSTFPQKVDFYDAEGLEFIMRTDVDMNIFVNLKCEDNFEDANVLYQYPFFISKGGWKRYQIDFTWFQMTRDGKMGRLRLEDPIVMEMGFTLMEKNDVDMDFNIEFKSITAKAELNERLVRKARQRAHRFETLIGPIEDCPDLD